MRKPQIIILAIIILGIVESAFGQHSVENKADQTLRGSGRVNASTLGMEFDLPLGSYPGRGINLPISLSYSSKVWRMKYAGDIPGGVITGGCRSVNEPRYADDSASGWTNSLAVPYIEYTGKDHLYTSDGFPLESSDPTLCDPNAPPNWDNSASYIRRLSIHLPSGETHELRADDTPVTYNRGSVCPPVNGWSCDPNSYWLQANWDRTFYAVDGSNIKYIEDSTTNTYRLLMPDGSSYDFASTESWIDDATVRKATKFTDRNGNFTSYNDSTGVWTDTLGRTFTAPMGSNEPSSPATQTYTMPGMTGVYRFHWKWLKGSSAAESGLTNFNQELRYLGDRYGPPVNSNWNVMPAGTFLFHSEFRSYIFRGELFNPVVLTEIELPTGQSYKFSYNLYGLIERITYPTGGEEKFVYNAVAPLTPGGEESVADQANFGVTNRKVYVTAGQGTPYDWNYAAIHVAPYGYKVSVTSPDQTRSERFLHQGYPSCSGCTLGNFGFDNGLAGMAYEELSFDNMGHAVTRKLTHWTKKTFTNYPVDSADWHPRVDFEEMFTYDTNGNGVSSTVKYEYEGDLNQRETPVLVNKTTQYAFVPIQGGENSGGGSFSPDDPPDPSPTPVPTPLPSSPAVKITESTYLINDPSYAGVKSYYIAQNMVGLVTATQVKDGAGKVVSRNETVYDESGRSPGYRGNPTTAKIWDSTKGIVTNSTARISTSAKFDTYGNQYESTDAKGNTTTTEYSATYNYAFPTKVTSPVPSDGVHGSNTAFVTTATFNPVTGLPLTTTDANGLETRVEYDPITLRPKNTKTYVSGTNTQVGSTAETLYHDEPNNYWVKNRAQIDADNWAESITHFDGLGRAWKSEEVNSNGNIFVEKEFDADGRVKRVSNPFRASETKVWTTNVYDEAGRVKEVILQDGAKIKTDYGIATTGSQIGITMTSTDEAGKQRRNISNALKQLVRVDEPDNNGSLGTISSPTQPTYYHYNGTGQMIRVSQGVQNRYFMYDSVGRMIRLRQPEQSTNPSLATSGNQDNNNWSAGFTYDDNGNMLTSIDAKGITIQRTYDSLNRPKTKSYSDSTPTVTFKYDNITHAKGKLIEISSSVSAGKTTSFDIIGRPTIYQQETDGNTYVSTYTYDLTRLIKETYPSGREVYVDYNQDNDISRIWGIKGSTTTTYANLFAYNAAGGVDRLRLGNGKWETVNYNARQQITQLGLGNGSADASIWKMGLEYGELQTNRTVDSSKNSGNIAKLTLTVPGMTNSIAQTFNYDSLDRLVEAKELGNGTQNWIQSFGYDRYGNRTSFSQTIGGTTTTTTPSIDINTNRFSSSSYTFDGNGNLTVDAEGRQFTFNGENKQTQVRDVSNNVVGTYYYNGEGKRIKKVTATETTIFVYSGPKLIAEYSTATLPASPTVNYPTSDHLGSPRVITNAVGDVTSRRDFMPYGEEIYVGIGTRTVEQKYSTGSLDNVRKRFTGYEKDTETGLDFAEARYYDNRVGRFSAVDPMLASGKSADPQTFNRYVYVGQNPVVRIDPNGLKPVYLFKKLPNGDTEYVFVDDEKQKKQYQEYLNQNYQLSPEPMGYQFTGTDGNLYRMTTTGFQLIRSNSPPDRFSAESTGDESDHESLPPMFPNIPTDSTTLGMKTTQLLEDLSGQDILPDYYQGDLSAVGLGGNGAISRDGDAVVCGNVNTDFAKDYVKFAASLRNNLQGFKPSGGATLTAQKIVYFGRLPRDRRRDYLLGLSFTGSAGRGIAGNISFNTSFRPSVGIGVGIGVTGRPISGGSLGWSPCVSAGSLTNGRRLW